MYVCMFVILQQHRNETFSASHSDLIIIILRVNLIDLKLKDSVKFMSVSESQTTHHFSFLQGWSKGILEWVITSLILQKAVGCVIFELLFCKKNYLLVGSSGMLWTGGSVRDVCMSHQSDWIYY